VTHVTVLDAPAIVAENKEVSGQETLHGSGMDRAALAFSIMPSRAAETVNQRLTISERMRLREGLSRVHDASDGQRMDALRALARAVDSGFQWPRPSVHDEAECPFRLAVESHPRQRAVDVLERVTAREALEAAVTLCHLPGALRDELWNGLSTDARGAIITALEEVHGVSTVRTRAYARDITTRLSRSIRFSRVAAG
jgi:hypothetical protein